jgi:hypothetical protein
MLPKDKRASEEDLASLFEDRDFLWNAKHHNGLLKEAKASKARHLKHLRHLRVQTLRKLGIVLVFF